MKWMLWVVTAAACGSSQSLAGDAGVVVDSPVADAVQATTLQTDWIESQTTMCATPPVGGTELYASCNVPFVWMRGAVVCLLGVQTFGCAVDTDCPAGTQCVLLIGASPADGGICEKTCTTAGNADCGRCDLWCELSSNDIATVPENVCDFQGPGYPANLPCDANHPGIDAAVHGVSLGSGNENAWVFDLPGASFNTAIVPKQISNDGDVEVVFPWPAGTTSGPASATYMGNGPGASNPSGTATFTADPTACVSVTIQVSNGLPDAGP